MLSFKVKITNNNGSCVLRPKHAPKMVLDVKDAGTAPGTNIQLHESNNSPAQDFWFYKLEQAPHAASVSADKKKYAVGDRVKFTYGCKLGYEMGIPVDLNGTRVDWLNVDQRGSREATFTQPGTYSYALYARNPYGEICTEFYSFEVYDPEKETNVQNVSTSAYAASSAVITGNETSDEPAKGKKLGDVDGYGEITANDSLMILRSGVGLEKLTPEQIKLADIDGDGEITSNDALAALRIAVGI